MSVRPEDVLPDGQDSADFGGLALRKGTVAAFVRNAQRYVELPDDAPEAAELKAALAETVPQLRAIGVLDVFVPASPRIKTIVDEA